MKVTVIIPTYNAGNQFSCLLDKLRSQTIHDFELIIIDSSSSDETADIAKKYTDKVVVIPQAEFDHGGTRGKAAKMAQGEIIVFLTQDALPCDEFTLENIVGIFDDTNIGAAYGRQVSYEDTNIFGRHLRYFNYGDLSYVRKLSDKSKYGIKTAFLSDSFAAYRKSALYDIGYFKSDLILGEDTYAGAKMLLKGYSLAYVADAAVYHSHSYTVMEEFRRYFDIGVFHACEDWILKEFGKAEGEGTKYVKSELHYILSAGKWYNVPEFFIRNGMKYLGYKLGNKYTILPEHLIQKLSMHKRWWKKKTVQFKEV